MNLSHAANKLEDLEIGFLREAGLDFGRVSYLRGLSQRGWLTALSKGHLSPPQLHLFFVKVSDSRILIWQRIESIFKHGVA